jgi:membrane-associated phospholipid phosphatase
VRRSTGLLITVLLLLAIPAHIQAKAEVNISIEPVTFTFSSSNLPYNASLDQAATAAALGSLVMPFALVSEDGTDSLWRIPVYYSAAIGTSFVLKEVLKSSFSHPRPYAYQNYYRETDEQLYDSFPSGHTTLTTTAAVFTAIVYHRAYPHSPHRFPVTASVTLLSTTASGLRLFSGSHHPKDVAAGMVLGALVGGLFGYLYTL